MDYGTEIIARLKVLAKQYEEITGRKAFYCRIPPERGVFRFMDGTALVSPEGAISHMELLLQLAGVRVNEP